MDPLEHQHHWVPAISDKADNLVADLPSQDGLALIATWRADPAVARHVCRGRLSRAA